MVSRLMQLNVIIPLISPINEDHQMRSGQKKRICKSVNVKKINTNYLQNNILINYPQQKSCFNCPIFYVKKYISLVE